MNIQLIAEQIGHIHLTLETQDAFEVYGGTALAPFEVSQTGTAQWTLTVRERTVVAAPLRQYNVYARQLATGREWEVLSGKILVSARTAAVPADKLAPVEYFVTVPVVDHDVDAVGSTIVQGIPGPQGPKGDPGPPGEGGMTKEERTTLAGAAQRDADNTFTASNTFTGSVDMSTASVTPPDGWNVEGVTAEAIKEVAPIAWGTQFVRFGEETQEGVEGTAIGSKAKAHGTGNVAIGRFATTGTNYNVAIGRQSCASGVGNVAIGVGATVKNSKNPLLHGSIAIGADALTDQATTITLGAQFTETTDSGNVTHACTTEGTGSITIGAGANTKNNGSTESSNSVTIGCKASNSGADSVVIGAQAKGVQPFCAIVGAGASTNGSNNAVFGYKAAAKISCVAVGMQARAAVDAVAVGKDAVANNYYSTAVGVKAEAMQKGIALGHETKSKVNYAIAIGSNATVSDQGATVIRSTAEDGTYTQLYFSGANTPLANTYHGGAPMLGYVTKDSAGNIVAAGTRSLIDLLTDNSTFAPASLDENGEWVMPKVFHPSDLDLPPKEPSEPEDYQPLPVWPIVEPSEDELRTPTQAD